MISRGYKGQKKGGGRMERLKKKVCVLEDWEGGRENGDEDCVCVGSRGTLWQSSSSEEVWQRPHFVRPLIFYLRTRKQSGKHALSRCCWHWACAWGVWEYLLQGRRLMEAGPWTHHAPQCLLHLWGLLVMILIEIISLRKRLQTLCFCKNQILSSAVAVGAGMLD